MKLTKITIFHLIFLTFTGSYAHLLLSLESTWGLSQSLENPLNSGSTNWFCHGASRNTDKYTTLKAGSSVSVPIVCGEATQNPTNGGSICSDDLNAYHNGGGCALSIAYTQNPDISDFVMFSVNGQCPSKNIAMIPFSIPENLPSGDAVCSWTWIPDPSASANEMYMNCFNCRIVNDNFQKTGSFSIKGNMLQDHLWAIPGQKNDDGDRGLYKDVFETGPLDVRIEVSEDQTTATNIITSRIRSSTITHTIRSTPTTKPKKCKRRKCHRH